jgi:hypothetical protein
MQNADLTRWSLHWSGTLQLEVSTDTHFSIYPAKLKFVPRHEPWFSTSWVIAGSLLDRRYERVDGYGYKGYAYSFPDYRFMYKMTWGRLNEGEITPVYSGENYCVPNGDIHVPDGAPGTVVVTSRTSGDSVVHLYLKDGDDWEPKSRPATMDEVLAYLKLAYLARDSVP